MEQPLYQLRELERAGATGELIAVVESIEVCVYLLRGRIAWAISSDSGGTLLHHLQDRCRIDREQVRSVLDECRRTVRPLGETLVARGLATHDQVKDALRQQIREVFSRLQGLTATRALFVPREVRYSEALTFTLDEVSHHAARSSGRPDGRSPQQLLEDLWASLSTASWLELRRDGEVVAATGRPEGRAPGHGAEDLRALCLDARLPRVTARSAHGSIIGQALHQPGMVAFCGVPHAEDLGLAGAVLRMHGPREDESLVPPHPTDYRTWTHGAADRPLYAVEAAFRELPELDAVFTTSERECAWGIYRVHRSLKARVEPVQAWDVLLDASLEPCFPVRKRWEALDGDATALSFEHAEGTFFGRRLAANSDRTLWIVMRRGETRSLGWGVLRSFAALLAGLPGLSA
jgi:hypothetical protein